MVNISKKVLNKNNSNDYEEAYAILDSKVNDNSKQINDLNNKFDEFHEIMLQKFYSINLENKKVNSLNELISNDFISLVEENKNMADELDSLMSVNDNLTKDIGVLKKENKNMADELDSLMRVNDNLTKDIEVLKKENKKLKVNFNKNNKILNSYNDNFKLLFYFYDLTPKGILKHLQNLCQEVLDFVSNVCKKYDIEYWLEGGTHLGAARHGGFLPWDDDIDIGMMRTDYNKFLEIFKLEIENHGLENDMKFRLLRHGNNVLYFIQISCAKIAILDIFPCDYIENPPDNIRELYHEEKSKFKSNILDGKSYEEAIKEVHDDLKLSYNQKPFVIPGVERPALGSFHVQEIGELFPLKEICFNGKKYPCLKNDDYHLQNVYGDWKSLPKVLERHNRPYLFLNRPDRINDLKESYKLLKSINDSFK